MQPDDPQYHQHFLFDPEWYESIAYYRPTDELLRVVRAAIPTTWRFWRNKNWFHVRPPETQLPRQGWKIHVSATPTNCDSVLRNVATICFQREAPFKFAIDRHLVALSTSKNWPRQASGKFITIYPLNDQHFFKIIEVLCGALRDFVGPYILSDRRYKDSPVIYYRYGGIEGFQVLTIRGDQQYMLVSPDGQLVPDLRAPYWNPPAWVSDPFKPLDYDEDNLSLKNGRYNIERALGFSAIGGVYLASDLNTGSTVVIKEARPATGIDENGTTAIDRLQKEYRLLQQLHDTGITPMPIDLFWDWEHLFLVEEYIPGLDLGHFTIGFNPLMRVYPDERAMDAYIEKLRKIWVNLAAGIAAMHDRGIVCGDLSIKNVIVQYLELGDVRIVDLEAAWEEGVDLPTRLATPGFTSPTRRSVPSKEDDFYALGAVMLGTLFPMNNLLDVEPSMSKVLTETLGTDLGLPKPVRQLIQKCMSNDASERPTPHQVIEVIQQSPARHVVAPINSPISREELLEIVSNTTNYIHASVDLHREDRLFPADPLLFFTNPLSIAYGAVGVAYALSKIEGEVPNSIFAWILSQPINSDAYPPGLYLGSAGIAWGLWELGLEEVALQVLRAAESHPLLWDRADIFYGACGYGLACLRFYLGTGDQMWLDQAVQVGERLLSSKVEKSDRGCCWPDKEGNVWLGYAQGASGIGLYLLYLTLATGEQRFLETGKRALAFDLSYARMGNEEHLSIPRGRVGSFEEVLTHYWLDGSAGVATVLVRYWACTKSVEYIETLKRLAPDTFRNYTVFPGLFRGLSGLGNFLLDAYDFTGDVHYLHEANKVARGVTLFKIQRSRGIAFPGEQLLRLTTDFGTGSAGIALFLNRLAHVSQAIGNFNFTLDQLIQGHSVEDKR